MHWYVPRPFAAFLLGWLAFTGSAAAQTVSLRQAVDAAWSLSPQAQALASRQAEFDARERAVSSLMAGPPSLSMSHRTDRVGANAGMRESELELSAPVWSPGVRRATAAQVQAERAAFALVQAQERLKLAEQVREQAALAALARIERDAAAARLAELQVLTADVQRRLTAGDVARVDLLQAQSVQQQTAGLLATADGALARALAQWRALTGLAEVSALDEQAADVLQDHPAVLAAQAQLRAAQARQALVLADRRDPLEVGVGMARERSAFGAANENSLKISLRIPLGTQGRNAAKIAAAQAELDAAAADALAAARGVQSEREATRAELEGARRAQTLAAERERGSREVQALIAKSWRLGESDLPARLRADHERFEAERAHARAQLETRRAIARLNQANGIFP